MSKMIEIKGKQVSEDAADLALQEYFETHPEKYIFQAGDVVQSYGLKRIIVKHSGELISFDSAGVYQSTGQGQFERYYYTKIGELKDLLKD